STWPPSCWSVSLPTSEAIQPEPSTSRLCSLTALILVGDGISVVYRTDTNAGSPAARVRFHLIATPYSRPFHGPDTALRELAQKQVDVRGIDQIRDRPALQVIFVQTLLGEAFVV